ncbi:TPA: DUF262 domain-containing protein [Yersinia enterocolitica]|uniref:DUF262 domain-containing protein n=1 Tax=Yersinia bercovieri TaxID=634 RepID=UPI001CFC9C64|nr:DUF262 domain-containing protein [Yersinia bercovieri]MCB5301986.1 DUF262 domain-containing protein [Yersinia bercovieri]HEN3627069.1 DUF262 domain-containing protein [Yersinia enterocolitica]
MHQGKTISFAGLFTEVDLVEIPIIQRDYAQGRKEVWEIREQFLLSIWNALATPSGGLSLDLDFIYGNLCNENPTLLSVLDGQQRLTTLFLLHWFLANKEGMHIDFSERFTHQGKSRFTYQTRTAAAEFFHALVCTDNSRLSFEEHAPSLLDQIVDSHWFYHSWLLDPTVTSSLTMLVSIQKCFSRMTDGFYERLCSNEKPIVFHYLNLEAFGLSDDLYIKMNSRGKALTAFENFKAWLSGRMNKQSNAEEFSEKIDQVWTDLFWNLSKKNTVNFDSLFLRFFKRMAFLLECSQSSQPAYELNNQSAAWFNSLRDSRDQFTSMEFEQRDIFNPESILTLSTVLDFLCSGYATQEHKSLLQDFLTGNDLLSLCRFYALSVFISTSAANIERYEPESHARWTRITDNFLHTTRIDGYINAVGIIRALDKLSPHSNDIYIWLNSNNDRQSFSEQWDEEALKAELILSDSQWEPILIKAESHPYLRGRIRGLLGHAHDLDGGGYDLARFSTLTEKTFWVLNEKMLSGKEHLLERALLSMGDYLVWQKGARFTFCMPSHHTWRERYENWIKVVEKAIFAELLDRLTDREDVRNTLKTLINGVDCGGWRELVVRDPEAISYCSERIVDKKHNQIYLLSKTNFRGYFRELHSWALAKKMQHLLREEGGNTFYTAVTYHPIYGDAWPYIELVLAEGEVRFIAHNNGSWFDCYNEDEKGEPLPLPPFFLLLVEMLIGKAEKIGASS